YRDYDTLASFARDVDVLTFDHEHVPTQHLAQLQQSGVPLAPGPDALVYAQDKLAMRAKMAELNLPSRIGERSGPSKNSSLPAKRSWGCVPRRPTPACPAGRASGQFRRRAPRCRPRAWLSRRIEPPTWRI